MLFARPAFVGLEEKLAWSRPTSYSWRGDIAGACASFSMSVPKEPSNWRSFRLPIHGKNRIGDSSEIEMPPRTKYEGGKGIRGRRSHACKQSLTRGFGCGKTSRRCMKLLTADSCPKRRLGTPEEIIKVCSS